MKNRIVKHFYVKETKKDRIGEAPIYLRVTVNGERAEVSTNRRISPDNWDKSSERVVGRSEAARIINTALENISAKVEKYFSNLDIKEDRISVNQIIAELRGKGQNQMTLLRAYEYHIKTIKELEGKDYAVATINKYGYSLKNLKRFLQQCYNKYDFRLCDLNRKFIENYHSYLRTTENLMHNSAAKSISHLKRVINISLSNNWIQKDPFTGFSCTYINPKRDYLTEEEIDSLILKKFSNKRLSLVRDLFIFQVYTGLAYIDMAELTEDNLEIGIDGKRWIVINRKKTGIRSSIPVLPRTQEILDRYRTDPLCNAKGKILPIYCNQIMNGYLKEIAAICGINKTLTTHIGRHTFATTITLSHGVPIETVSKMLGHTDLKTTQIYSKVVDRKIAEDMKKFTATPSNKITRKKQNG
jgi:site-specific recombinase XerD